MLRMILKLGKRFKRFVNLLKIENYNAEAEEMRKSK